MKDGKKSPIVVEVIPIARGIAKPALSYFTTQEMAVGDFVKVPVRNKSVLAVVSAVHNATEAKTNLKRSTYSLKKIASPGTKSGTNPHLSRPFIAAAEQTAFYYASPLGAVLGALIPKVFLDNHELAFSKTPKDLPPTPTPAPRSEPLVIQLEHSERMAQYKSIIRECLAKKSSIMLVVPTDEEAQRMFNLLSHGIEEYAYLFTLKSTAKEQKRVIERVVNNEHSILLVTTPAGICLDRPDLNTILLERESSRAYRTLTRPHIHFKVFLEHYTGKAKKKLILGDSALSIESLWREKSGEYREFFPLTWRLVTSSESTLVDMKKPFSTGEKPEFKIISPELEELIGRALEEKSGIFLFGARKGLSPTTVCEDCGTILACKNCGAPVVLYSKPTGNIYVCHACEARRPPETTCDTCKGWRLAPLGIGIDRIKEEVLKLFPKSHVVVLDKNHAPTDARAKKIAREFQEHGGILIGTELGLLHVEKAKYAGLVSADALFSIPDFGIHERIFHLVTKIREIAEKETIFQTRNVGQQILSWAVSGNILEFYKTEISEREEMLYPPFSVFIKISGKNISSIIKMFEKWHPDTVKDSLVIRVAREKWPDPELVTALSLLTPDFLIKVDPESIL